MKPRGFVVLCSLIALLLMTSLACNTLVKTPEAPTPIPPQQPTRPSQPNQLDRPTPTRTSQNPTNVPPPSPSNQTGGLKTFTDQKNFYQIQVPNNWNYKQSTGEHYYIDQFKSPDTQALVENIVYAAEVEGGQLVAADDADQAAWFSRSELPALAFKATRTILSAW